MRMGAPDRADAPMTTHRGAAIYGISSEAMRRSDQPSSLNPMNLGEKGRARVRFSVGNTHARAVRHAHMRTGQIVSAPNHHATAAHSVNAACSSVEPIAQRGSLRPRIIERTSGTVPM